MPPEIIAHRGASADAPENTLAALRLGFDQGADAVECDVRRTRDGRVVVIHDSDTRRTAGIDGKIAAQTFAALRSLDVGSFGPWGGKGFAQRIPALDELLPLVPPGKRLFIEIKCGPEVLADLDATLARSQLRPQQTVIITFSHTVAHAAKSRFPDRPVCLLASYARNWRTGRRPVIGGLVRKAREAGLDGLDLDARFRLDAAAVQKVKSAGLMLYVWTVDDAARARDLIAAGVDGITTNRPGALRRELQLAV